MSTKSIFTKSVSEASLLEGSPEPSQPKKIEMTIAKEVSHHARLVLIRLYQIYSSMKGHSLFMIASPSIGKTKASKSFTKTINKHQQ